MNYPITSRSINHENKCNNTLSSLGTLSSGTLSLDLSGPLFSIDGDLPLSSLLLHNHQPGCSTTSSIASTTSLLNDIKSFDSINFDIKSFDRYVKPILAGHKLTELEHVLEQRSTDNELMMHQLPPFPEETGSMAESLFESFSQHQDDNSVNEPKQKAKTQQPSTPVAKVNNDNKQSAKQQVLPRGKKLSRLTACRDKKEQKNPRRNRKYIPDDDKGYIPAGQKPTEYDVVGGRGGISNNHKGNRRYWSKVLESRRAYKGCYRNGNCQKNMIAQSIVNFIEQGGGRFLEREKSKSPSTTIANDGRFYVLPPKVALEKVKQALRDGYVPTWARGKATSNQK